MESFGPYPLPKQFVLCFDGTGNKFAGDASDTNLVKIYRMLDRSQSHQYHYYQPGIGTYITSHNLGSKSRLARIKSAYKKAKDAALGSSFDEHVLGGYKFLMRYYIPGDDIYFFGFSRGSYTARFLAEMLDFVGLLQPGNEELIRFAWKTFAKWQQRKDSTEYDREEKRRLFGFMKAFRETFSRPVGRVRFMGLFDTVNSVAMFENAWMERNKFPYSAHSSARVIRHAVSIDERRAKFRQDLISGIRSEDVGGGHRLRNLMDHDPEKANVPEIVLDGHGGDRRESRRETGHDEERYRASSPMPSRKVSTEILIHGSVNGGLMPDGISLKSTVSRAHLRIPGLHIPDSEEDNEQDISEVWFSGQHGDVGGGWKLNPEDKWPLSHIPLVWMVKEAQLVGLEFDAEKLRRFNCYEGPNLVPKDTALNGSSNSHGSQCRDRDAFHDTLTQTMDHGIVHDCLTYGGGVSFLSTLSWRLMEYLPFRRMDLQADGSWKPIRWPLPCGEVRDIPDDAQIHVSAIHRMQIDPTYRPGNLIIGGGGRGIKRAPNKYGIGEWEVCKHADDIVRRTYIRKKPDVLSQEIRSSV
ncbi:hypothetical protein N7520_009429 [Penicillium odoratum]|uniref:uncharacterized protein n=1 Tax=Penicillium odoratum TaxID=1167516 RepID=UPI0025475A2B|nr:uncharacterized protein N7520_009429 [Penicillium odoratum]KAJ5752512.1 hypothetical protein N7520_009429 [Penicillium odoratum]